jgi:hypothetical protein
MSKRLAVLALAVALGGSLTACEDCGGGGASVAPGPPSDAGRSAAVFRLVALDAALLRPRDAAASYAPPRTAPRTDLVTRPTPAAMDALATALAKASGAELARARVTHAGVVGDLEDLPLALAAIDAAIAADARVAIHHVERAAILTELRRFGDARAAVLRAKELGASPADVDLATADLDWSAGLYGPAADTIRRVAEESPSNKSLLRRARLEHETGNDVEAERLLDAAEDRAADGEPFPLADVYAQRGFLELDVGKPDDAKTWFEASLARVPDGTRALRGLAVALDRLGRRADAVAKLEPIAATTKDHELLAALARMSPLPTVRARANARFDVLLAKVPEAAYGPAAAFYLDFDAKRAVSLAQKVVATSPTADNQVLLARAELAAHDAQAARAAIDPALHAPAVSAGIEWTGARVYSRLGDSARASELAARARRRNPRIESEQPPLEK